MNIFLIFPVHQCLFCPQTFKTAAEKDDHILNHFDHEICSDCDQKLIRIGKQVFTLHTENTCIKRDVKLENKHETGFLDQSQFNKNHHREQSPNPPFCVAFPLGCENSPVKWIKEEEETIEEENFDNDFGNADNFQRVGDGSSSNFNQCSRVISSTTEALIDVNFNLKLQNTTAELPPRQDLASKQCEKEIELLKSTNHNTTNNKANEKVDTQPKSSSLPIKTHVETEKSLQIKNQSSKRTCSTCGKVLSSYSSLRSHKILLHSPPGTHFCNLCARIFSNVNDLTEHRKKCLAKRYIPKGVEENAIFQCYICKAILKTIIILRGHLRTQHSLIGKQYKCTACDLSFVEKWTMAQHFRNTHTEIRRFICTVCGKSFKKSRHLINHNYVHTGEKLYKCTHEGCDKCFRVDSSLRAHMRVHAVVKPFHCTTDGCDKRFSSPSSFKVHKWKVHGIMKRKIPCQLCSEVFPQEFLLKKHLQKHLKNAEQNNNNQKRKKKNTKTNEEKQRNDVFC